MSPSHVPGLGIMSPSRGLMEQGRAPWKPPSRNLLLSTKAPSRTKRLCTLVVYPCCVPMFTQLVSLPHCTISTTAQGSHLINKTENICDLSAIVTHYIYCPQSYLCSCLTNAGPDVLRKRGVSGSKSNTTASSRGLETGNGWLFTTLILFGDEYYWKTLRSEWGICKWNVLTLWLLALWEKEKTI